LNGPGGELHQHAKADPRVKVLRTLPGVGEFTALVLLAEIGDITRFGSARKLASWAGLTPAVRGPGPDRPARAHLEAGPGVAAVGPEPGSADREALPPKFAASYQAIAKRRGKKIATIAVARKLLTRARHLLAAAQAART
jgi:transposase